MNFNKYSSDRVNVSTLRNINTFISFLSLIGWLLMIYINFKVPYSWEFSDWIISPYLPLVVIALFQILAYPTLSLIDAQIHQRVTPNKKQAFTFQVLISYVVVVGMILYLAFITKGYIDQKTKAQHKPYNDQVMMDFNTLITKGCTLSGHQVKYNFYLQPIIVSDKNDADRDYSSYVSDQVSIGKERVIYRCVTGEQVSTYSLIRSFIN